MKKGEKRLVYFLVMWTFTGVQEYFSFLINGKEWSVATSWFALFIVIVPLFFFGDDSE